MSGDPLDNMSPEDHEFLAAEYALGVLDADQMKLAAGVMDRDPDFAALVWDWSNRLAPLSHHVAWLEPDPSLWPKIQARLASPEAAQPTESATSDIGAEIIQLRRAVRTWRAAAIAITAIAASAALLLFANPAWLPPLGQDRADAAQDHFVALLAPPGSEEAGWVAMVDLETRQIMLVPYGVFETPGEQVHELWYIQDSDSAPRSLGLIAGSGQLPVPAAALERGGTLAVSLEPRGGSPTGLPTGPVVLLGDLTPIP